MPKNVPARWQRRIARVVGIVTLGAAAVLGVSAHASAADDRASASWNGASMTTQASASWNLPVRRGAGLDSASWN